MRRAQPLVAAALALVLALPQSGSALDESEMGRRFLLEARAELPFIQDPAVSEYVERIGRKLVGTLGPQPFDYQFFVVQSPALNAFAVPGGYVFVFSGLLAQVRNDDELAGVLAHEIGHAHAHHITRLQTAATPWTVAAILGMLLSAVNPVLGAGAVAAAESMALRYSRDFEQEADYLGLRFATDAGYDPHAMGSFFKELLAEQRLNQTGVPPYMLTHPLTEDRIAHIETTITHENLKTPAGRPASSPDLAEAQAVSRAIAEPADVVIGRYRRLAEEKPNDAESQFLLGRVYQTVGKLEAARTALERARDLGGLGGRVDRPLGAVYAALKARPEAEGALRRYLAAHPDDGWSHVALGKVLADGGDQQAALKEFQRALVLDPGLDEAHRLAGLALGRQGDQAEGFYHLAVASRLRGELEQALSHYQRTAALLPPGSPRRKEVDQAIEELRPIVSELQRQREERRRTGRRLSSPDGPWRR